MSSHLPESPAYPWERRPTETSPAWEAFVIYRDLAPSDRSVNRVASEVAKHRTLIGRWSSVHDWVDRVASWDMEQDRRKRVRHLAQVEKVSGQHATQAASLLAALLKPTEVFLRRWGSDEAFRAEIEGLGARDLLKLNSAVARLVPALQQAHRLAMGMTATEVGVTERPPAPVPTPAEGLDEAERRVAILAALEEAGVPGFAPGAAPRGAAGGGEGMSLG